MFQLTLGPTDHRTLHRLACSDRERLRRALHRERRRPAFRLAGSLAIGRLRLAASCTLESSRAMPARCRPVT